MGLQAGLQSSRWGSYGMLALKLVAGVLWRRAKLEQPVCVHACIRLVSAHSLSVSDVTLPIFNRVQQKSKTKALEPLSRASRRASPVARRGVSRMTPLTDSEGFAQSEPQQELLFATPESNTL
jgi:hypothetical protein